MADSEDLQSQLEIQNAINAAIKQRNDLLKAQGSILGNQLRLSVEMCDAMGCKNLEGMADRLDEITSALEGASEQAEEMAENVGDAADAAADGADKGAGGMGKFTKGIKGTHVAGLGMFKGLAKGFAGGLMDLKSIVSAAMAVTKAFFKVGKAIISIPFRLLGALVDMANEGAGASTALREAYEELRGTLGDLAYGEAKAAHDMFQGFKDESKDLAGTGLSLTQVFGRGIEES